MNTRMVAVLISGLWAMGLTAPARGQQAETEGARTCPSSKGAYFRVQSWLESQRFQNDAEFQPIAQALQSFCFRQQETGAWVYSDDSARLVVTARPLEGVASLSFRPHHATPFGDASVAALITRAAEIRLDGDTIEVGLPTRSIGLSARATDTLRFELGGGAWSETRLLVQWGNPRK